MEKLIRNVDKKSWRELKVEAMRHQLTIGEFLAHLIKEHKELETKKPQGWDYIFAKRKKLSDEDAKAMHLAVEEAFEKEYGFEG